MRGVRHGDDGMRKRVRAMLSFMNIQEVDQPNKGRIHIDKEALMKEVEGNGGKIVFDEEGYRQYKSENTTANHIPNVDQKVRPRYNAAHFRDVPLGDSARSNSSRSQDTFNEGRSRSDLQNYPNGYDRRSRRGSDRRRQSSDSSNHRRRQDDHRYRGSDNERYRNEYGRRDRSHDDMSRYESSHADRSNSFREGSFREGSFREGSFREGDSSNLIESEQYGSRGHSSHTTGSSSHFSSDTQSNYNHYSSSARDRQQQYQRSRSRGPNGGNEGDSQGLLPDYDQPSGPGRPKDPSAFEEPPNQSSSSGYGSTSNERYGGESQESRYRFEGEGSSMRSNSHRSARSTNDLSYYGSASQDALQPESVPVKAEDSNNNTRDGSNSTVSESSHHPEPREEDAHSRRRSWSRQESRRERSRSRDRADGSEEVARVAVKEESKDNNNNNGTESGTKRSSSEILSEDGDGGRPPQKRRGYDLQQSRSSFTAKRGF
mmetsp:Transcript_7308/g.16589  ORF Transcript_7308/g.16589 Transcript_7308/m.16589 type:complete len:487 (+) Transcript_7308:1820-3280(+)